MLIPSITSLSDNLTSSPTQSTYLISSSYSRVSQISHIWHSRVVSLKVHCFVSNQCSFIGTRSLEQHGKQDRRWLNTTASSIIPSNQTITWRFPRHFIWLFSRCERWVFTQALSTIGIHAIFQDSTWHHFPALKFTPRALQQSKKWQHRNQECQSLHILIKKLELTPFVFMQLV